MAVLFISTYMFREGKSLSSIGIRWGNNQVRESIRQVKPQQRKLWLSRNASYRWFQHDSGQTLGCSSCRAWIEAGSANIGNYLRDHYSWFKTSSWEGFPQKGARLCRKRREGIQKISFSTATFELFPLLQPICAVIVFLLNDCSYFGYKYRSLCIVKWVP